MTNLQLIIFFGFLIIFFIFLYIKQNSIGSFVDGKNAGIALLVVPLLIIFTRLSEYFKGRVNVPRSWFLFDVLLLLVLVVRRFYNKRVLSSQENIVFALFIIILLLPIFIYLTN